MNKPMNDPTDPIGYDGLASPITLKGTYSHPDPDNLGLTLEPHGKLETFLVSVAGAFVGIVKLVKKI